MLFHFPAKPAHISCREGKSQLVIGVGCTGGKHRSVAIAETLNRHFADQGLKAKVTHRDILKDR